eukprot:87496_1
MASFWISLTAFIFFVFGHHYCNTTTCTGWSTQVTYLGERSEGVVWNGSRYTFRNVIAADETERWKCHARHCNACIYLKDKEFYKYKPHEYDDADARSYEYNLHSDDEPHESWNQSALVSHDAGEFMQELVKLGVHPTKSYQQYILQNPDEVIHFKNKSVFEHKLSAARSQSHAYPPKPSKLIKVNNFAETQNKQLLDWLGVHESFWPWLLKLKEFSALQMLKWKQFKTFKHQRMKSVKEHTKIVALHKLWGLIGRQGVHLFDYLQGVSFVYSGNWVRFETMFGALTIEDNTF